MLFIRRSREGTLHQSKLAASMNMVIMNGMNTMTMIVMNTETAMIIRIMRGMSIAVNAVSQVRSKRAKKKVQSAKNESCSSSVHLASSIMQV